MVGILRPAYQDVVANDMKGKGKLVHRHATRRWTSVSVNLGHSEMDEPDGTNWLTVNLRSKRFGALFSDGSAALPHRAAPPVIAAVLAFPLFGFIGSSRSTYLPKTTTLFAHSDASSTPSKVRAA